jgi:hypothetical protein
MIYYNKRVLYIVLAAMLIVLSTLCITALAEEINEKTPDSSGKYNYELDGNIPRKIQAEALEYIISEDAGFIGEKINYSNSYNKLLESYLRYYGIFAPLEQKSDITAWTQETLKNSKKIQYIPEAYYTAQDLIEWVTRYAIPGDLLLYKTNGNPDRCLVYTGEGSAIIKRNETFKILPFPPTYVTGDYNRSKSSGLYAIAHLWQDNNDDKYVEINIRTEKNITSFTGTQYRLMEYNQAEGVYSLSKEYIIFEKEPGLYAVWNGSGFGIKLDHILNNNGIHIQLVSISNNPTEIPQKCKVEIQLDDIDLSSNALQVEYIQQEKKIRIWNGKEIQQQIKMDNR